MSKKSTLIYFVNNLEADLTNCENHFSDNFKRLGLTGNNNGVVNPPEAIVHQILNFARIYEVLKTEAAGHTELILN